MEFRKGPWTEEEDSKLINYINIQGEGPWNSIAHCAGLNRTGKSCRLRWVNYLCPHVRRGNLSLEEQFLILHLHCRWGNRWSKIAQQLPGRTDNEIKNYWRTRIQKQAKQLNCDVNSNEFRDTIRYLLMPRLVDQIRAASAAFSTAEPTSTFTTGTDTISIIHDSFATPYHILADPTSSEYETVTSIASSQFLEQQFVFAPAAASASELADCDDVVMANNWSGDLTDGVVSGLTWGSLTGVCEQDRFDDGDGALPLLENGNAWLGGGGSIDAMLINDVGACV